MARNTRTRTSRWAVRPLAALLALAAVTTLAAGPVAAIVPFASLAPGAAGLAPGLRAELVGDPSLDVAALLARVASEVLPASSIAGRPPVTAPAPKASGYRGRNHVWSSTLAMNDTVVFFSCTRSRPPDMAVYRWGCAGANNVYLFAHAGGPFRGLHDAYVRGRLRKGTIVTYADGSGQIHRFAIAWWKVVPPTDAGFAIAAQSRSSMTLQTCVGLRSAYRLVVRLYEAP